MFAGISVVRMLDISPDDMPLRRMIKSMASAFEFVASMSLSNLLLTRLSV